MSKKICDRFNKSKDITKSQVNKDSNNFESGNNQNGVHAPIKFWPIFYLSKKKVKKTRDNFDDNVIKQDVKKVEVEINLEQETNSEAEKVYKQDEKAVINVHKIKENGQSVINVDQLPSNSSQDYSADDCPLINSSKLLNDLIHGCYVNLEQLSPNSLIAKGIKFPRKRKYTRNKMYKNNTTDNNSLFQTRFGRRVRFTEPLQAGFS